MRRALVAAGAAFFLLAVTAAAADPVLRLVAQDATTVTLGWDPVSGAEGFRFSSSASSKRSHTWNGAVTQVRFAKADSYMVERIDTSVVGVYPGTPEPPPPPPPSGMIAVGASWQAAYDAAAADSTLTVAAGNHGSPALTGTKPVTFLGADGAVVAKMPGNASNVTFDNIDVNTGSTHGQYNASEPRGQNITWRRADVTGNWASIHTWDSATGFRWLGGTLIAPGQRNCSTADGQPLWLGADNATIDAVTFGVFDSGDCGSSGSFHMEAIRVQGASDIRILNVTFSANSDTGSGHIFVTTTSPSARQPRRLTVENTVFPRVIGSYAIQVHGNVNPIDGWVVRRSQFDQGVLNQAPFTNLTACGNTGSVPSSWKAPC